MKNWALLAVAVVASGSMVLGSAACTVGSDSGDAGGSAGSAGSSAAGAAGSVAAGAGGSAAGAGGSGTGTVITQYFSDPDTKACADCLGTMTGKLASEPSVDCSMVVTKCGASGCDDTMDCISTAISTNGYDKSFDCAVAKDCQGAIAGNSEGEDFVNCMAEKCGTQCYFTPGFTTTVCKLSRAVARPRGRPERAPFAVCAPRRARPRAWCALRA